ncbi:hypothetical protein BgAZ_301950 [Babesia gibsoni]|uniref:Histone RNA hairpin-binding protein RNA-binding domain-containing protein n=1 Tax=Babesia gibsoni TaxID=33632 RepID=A0AAD8LQS9_BABGI|nr:hypothetical protein BgAZ_301950 [Babesia gibsoni]
MNRNNSFRSDSGVFREEADSSQISRAANRLKNINLTKANESYERYLRAVPRECRLPSLSDSWHPVTPDHRSKATISQWNKEISAWRKRVYLWNSVTDSQCDLLADAVRNGDIKGFLRICKKTEEPATRQYSHRTLLDPKSNAVAIEPVLYKPRWFNGEITHSGFHTIDEKEFVDDAAEIYRNSNDNFRKFYEEYVQSYTGDNVEFEE